MTSKAGELRVVAYAVQERVEEDGFAIGAELAHGAGGKLYWFGPVGVRGEQLLEEDDGAVVGGVDGFDGVEGDVGVFRDGKAGEAFGVAEFHGDDVLEEFGDNLCACYVAGLGEEFGVVCKKLPPVLGGLFVPVEDLFGGEDGLGHACSWRKARWPMSRRNCMPSKDIFASSA